MSDESNNQSRKSHLYSVRRFPLFSSSDHTTTNRASKPDHGQRFVPGSEQAPENSAPQSLDHFNRGYQERASLRVRETEALGSRKTFDARGFVDVLSRPGCNLAEELEKARVAPHFHLEKAMTSTLSTLARSKNIDRAFAVWQWMDSAGVEKNVFHYSAMISACEKAKDHRRAVQLLQEMDSKGIAKNHIAYSSAISACEKAGQWRDALRLLDQMKSSGVLPTVVAYNAAISACEKGLVPQRALQLFDQMKRDGVMPTVVTYSALISAADKGQQWKLALEILEEMKAAGHGANVIGKFDDKRVMIGMFSG
jgi:pentatricopeptide repeat protein